MPTTDFRSTDTLTPPRISSRTDSRLQALHTLVRQRIDGTSALAGAISILNTVCGFLNGLVLPVFLSVTDIGIIYIFRNALSICNNLELGAGAVTLRLAAYTMGKRSLGDNVRSLATVYKTAYLTGKWVALSVGVALGIATVFYILQVPEIRHDSSLLWIWGIAAVASCVLIYNGVREQFVMGCGEVNAILYMRAARTVLGTAALCGSLILGWGIRAVTFQFIVQAVLSYALLELFFGRLFSLLCSVNPSTQAAKSTWSHDVLPLQWRYGASSIAGIALFSAPVPILVALTDLAEVGRWGLSWGIIIALINVPNAMITSQEAKWCSLAQAEDYNQLARALHQTRRNAFLITSAAALGLVGLITVRQFSAFSFFHKLLPSWALLVLFFANAIPHVIGATMVSFVRSFKREPFLRVWWFTTAVGLPLMIVGSWTAGAGGCAAAFLLTHLAGLLGVYRIYRDQYNAVCAAP